MEYILFFGKKKFYEDVMPLIYQHYVVVNDPILQVTMSFKTLAPHNRFNISLILCIDAHKH